VELDTGDADEVKVRIAIKNDGIIHDTDESGWHQLETTSN